MNTKPTHARVEELTDELESYDRAIAFYTDRRLQPELRQPGESVDDYRSRYDRALSKAKRHRKDLAEYLDWMRSELPPQ